ncbi:MAG: hypothetical protein IKH19_04695 [Muribaculaceae bacterium]|nr:hypothetical protein [Muribaculaceae bacterium]
MRTNNRAGFFIRSLGTAIVCLGGSVAIATEPAEVVVDTYTPQNYSVIPPSPEVSSLMKYLDIPVSPFTGQPDITLPIYTVREGSLEVPVSISYHGGGIKVDELPGIIGLGWSLNAGGCVARTVHGLPDELNTGGTEGVHGLFNLDQQDKLLRQAMLGRNVNNNYNPCNLYGDNVLPYSMCHKFNEGRSDMANDIFHFGFLGHSGTFVIEPDTENLIVSTPSPVKITQSTVTQNGGEFKFVDDMGTTYTFQPNERTCFHYSHPCGDTQVTDTVYYDSAWHLSKVQSITGDSIVFGYETTGRKHRYLGSSHTYSISDTQYSQTVPVEEYKIHVHSVDYYCRALRWIRSRSAEVEFVYGNDYEKLEKIIVRRRTSTPETIKEFRFSQKGCFGAAESDKPTLAGIDEVGTDSTTVHLYSFNYEQNSNPGAGQDFWGYRNNGSGSHLYYINGDSHRDPDFNQGKTGVLSSIEYATGGTTTIDWEQNDYSFICTEAIASGEQQEISYHRRISGISGQEITTSNMSSPSFNKRIFITATPGHGGMIMTFDLSHYVECFKGASEWARWFGLIDGGAYWYKAHHGNGSNQLIDYNYPRIVIAKVIPSGRDTIRTIYIDEDNCVQPIIVPVTEGMYEVILKNPVNFETVSASEVNTYFGNVVTGGGLNADYGYIDIEVLESWYVVQSKRPWGGLRVASITHNPGNFVTITKRYAYRGSLSSTTSSGVVTTQPQMWCQSECYSAVTEAIMPASAVEAVWSHTVRRHSDGLYHSPLGGARVEYPVVWEWFEGDSVRTKYTFTSQAESDKRDVLASTFPDHFPGGSHMWTSNAHLRGDLVRKQFFRNDTLLRETGYDFVNREQSGTALLSSDFTRILDIDGANLLYENSNELRSSDYVTSVYQLIPYNKGLLNVTNHEITYFDNGQGQVSHTDSVSYTYFGNSYNPEPWAMLPRSESRLESDGTTSTTYYTYKRIGDNWVNLRETEVCVNGGTIEWAKRNEYDSAGRLVASYRAPTGLSDGGFQLGSLLGASQTLLDAINLPEYTYRYDGWNNLVEIRYNGVALASYLWGYQGSHPIAEIKGLAYETVCSRLPHNLRPETLLVNNAPTLSTMAGIRACFPDADVTTITYDWLVGAGTVTDSHGVTTRFTYDGLNRLSAVKDVNDYYIRKYDYHYPDSNLPEP